MSWERSKANPPPVPKRVRPDPQRPVLTVQLVTAGYRNLHKLYDYAPGVPWDSGDQIFIASRLTSVRNAEPPPSPPVEIVIPAFTRLLASCVFVYAKLYIQSNTLGEFRDKINDELWQNSFAQSIATGLGS